MNISEKFVDLGNTNLDVILTVGALSMQHCEKLLDVQRKATHEICSKGEQLREILAKDRESAKNPAAWAALYQSSLQSGIEAMRACYAINQQSLSDLSKVLGKQFAVMPEKLMEALLD